VTTPFSDPHRARAILLLSMAAFASAASMRICDAMLPALAEHFSTSTAEASHVVSFFAIAYGLLQAFFGTLGDRIGKYRLIAYCTLASTAGTLAAAFAGSLDWLVLARFLSGMTAAGIIPLSMAWIGDTVAYEHRQATLARFLGGQILGLVSGQFISGVFTDTFGWRWAFAFLATIFLGVGWRVLREARHNPSAQHVAAHPLVRASILTQVGVVLATPWARVVLVTVFIEGMLVFGPMAFVPTFLHTRFSVALTTAGVMMMAFGAGGFLYIVFARHFVRRLGEPGLAGVGGVMLALAWLILATENHWAWTPFLTFLAGLGFYQLHNTLQTNATQMAPSVRGTAVSLFASAFFLGQSLGVFISSHIFSNLGAETLFLVAAALIPVLGAVFSWRVKLHHRIVAAQAGSAS